MQKVIYNRWRAEMKKTSAKHHLKVLEEIKRVENAQIKREWPGKQELLAA